MKFINKLCGVLSINDNTFNPTDIHVCDQPHGLLSSISGISKKKKGRNKTKSITNYCIQKFFANSWHL